MAADVIVTTRQPTIRLPRVPDVEPGTLVALYWNGSIAGNGDGVPGWDAAISYTKPLVGPTAYWLKGHPHLYGGGYGVGGYGEPGAALNTQMGYGAGPYGVGGYGLGGGFWEWKPANLWRNGVYQIAARFRDSVGNEQETPAHTLSVEVRAVPRPVSKAWVVSFVAGILTVQWHPSPDFLHLT